MKKKYYLLLASIVLLGYSCEDAKEVPPRRTNTDRSFILPIPRPLTDAEWEVVDAKKMEYKSVNPDIK